MILPMTARITFPKHNGRKELVIRRITAVHIQSTFKELTSRATIAMPRNIRVTQNGVPVDKYNIKSIFRTGDPVIIELGYGLDTNLAVEFTGYVTGVSATIPLEISCEDEMWKLKQIPVNYSASKVTLQNLLADICPGYSVDALEGINLGGVRFAKTTVAKVLEKLQQDPWHLNSYMKGKQLVCGKYYSDDSSITPVAFDLETNIAENGLTYKSREETILKIRANSVLVNGSTIEFEMGDEGGDTMELTYYNIEVKAELERKVKEDYEKRKRGGFDGSFAAYGIPRVQHGMKVKLTSSLYPDRGGTYYVDGVNKDFVKAKYRQQIQLGGKVG